MIDQTFPNEEIVTFGDFKKDAKTGKLIPFETVLTHPIEVCSKMGLDYIFNLVP